MVARGIYDFNINGNNSTFKTCYTILYQPETGPQSFRSLSVHEHWPKLSWFQGMDGFEHNQQPVCAGLFPGSRKIN